MKRGRQAAIEQLEPRSLLAVVFVFGNVAPGRRRWMTQNTAAFIRRSWRSRDSVDDACDGRAGRLL